MTEQPGRMRSLQARLRWLVPGIGVKRWLLLLLAGATFLGLGFGYVLLDLYRTVEVPAVVSLLTLQFAPRLFRGALLALKCAVAQKREPGKRQPHMCCVDRFGTIGVGGRLGVIMKRRVAIQIHGVQKKGIMLQQLEQNEIIHILQQRSKMQGSIAKLVRV